MKKSQAFTLAEVLITLVIIGVIAAMTIPTLMGNTNNQELKTKAKKVVSAVNQAIKLDSALYGKQVTDYGGNGADLWSLKKMLTNHLSVIEPEVAKSVGSTANLSFKTADGIIYRLEGFGEPAPRIFVMLKVTGSTNENYNMGPSIILSYDNNSKTYVQECWNGETDIESCIYVVD